MAVYIPHPHLRRWLEQSALPAPNAFILTNFITFYHAVSIDFRCRTYHKYLYCDGIKQTAANSAFLLRPSDFTVTVSYDSGPGTSSLGTCDVSGGEAAISIPDEGRVNVTVVATYRPMVRLIPIPTRTFTSSSYRTILGILKLGN